MQRHRGTSRKTAASGPWNLWLQGHVQEQLLSRQAVTVAWVCGSACLGLGCVQIPLKRATVTRSPCRTSPTCLDALGNVSFLICPPAWGVCREPLCRCPRGPTGAPQGGSAGWAGPGAAAVPCSSLCPGFSAPGVTVCWAHRGLSSGCWESRAALGRWLLDLLSRAHGGLGGVRPSGCCRLPLWGCLCRCSRCPSLSHIVLAVVLET